MLNRIKGKMPNWLFIVIKAMRDLPKIINNYIYDIKRYIKYSSSVADNKRLKLEAQITAKYHVIEKGLSMPEPRVGFGKDRVNRLIFLLDRYICKGYCVETTQIQAAIQVLDKYFEFNRSATDNYTLGMVQRANNLFKDIKLNNHIGGTLLMDKDAYLAKTQINFKEFAYGRSSVRNFTEVNVDIDLLLESIKIAQKTPSVCNRQSSRVYLIKDKDKIKEALSLQNGNRGFGHLINKVLIVTSDLNAFKGLIERNQSFIDGGMYSMSLLYALHYHGLGACALNWAVEKGKDSKLRNALNIKENENIIMMIGVGHLPSSFSVPISKRKDLNEVITII
ncbi:nitroreductase [Paenibacillus endophyticus]|uniref:Nitroreductase n=1 Tax=Paenibacillus endophyticus TaxID=1294268 RepID=A0A7W5C8X4_9BACL|nr:nitroreductase family protein [Paenibacillus endophyticus]MBB3153303.1 nitroreductase [Paenibacillus endophyticus]